jgi:serine protease AprX
LDEINNLAFVSNIGQINKKISTDKSNVIDKFAIEEPTPFKANNSDPIYGNAFNQINMVNGIPLHESGFKGNGMVIAILDAGFLNVDQRAIFNSLWENNQILGSYDFVNPTSDVFGDHTHGTLVLSVMGGSLPDLFLGTAPEAGYWLLRTEDTNSEFLIEEYNWIAGAAFADSVGADIINSSVGYTQFDDATYNHTWTDIDGNTTEVTKAADLAAAKGILVVNSAGNSGNDAWKYLIAPADGDSVLAVGAVDANQIITAFSSYGFESDARIKPNIVAQGGNTVVANVSVDNITTSNGTSFSAPLIAGMMACLWQAIPNANNMEIIRAVEQSASRFSNPDNLYGYGIPDFSSAQLLLGLSDKINSENSLTVVPNPVLNSELILWDQSKYNFEWMELLDIQGRILIKEEINSYNNQYKLSLEGYNSGIYFLRFGNQNLIQTKKIIKID